ncbi:MAG: phosphatase PAP2 family protein [Candidatus Bipolaricaulia bacterium]
MGAWARVLGSLDGALEAVLSWDERAVRAVSASPSLRRFSRILITASYLGDGYLWGGLGLGLILFGRPPDRLFVLIGLGISIVNIAAFRFLKALFGRSRPESVGVGLRFHAIDTYAFPSGHATTSFALAWLVSRTYPHPAAVIFVYLIASMIAFSRVYVREHYPLDVLFGALFGTVMAVLLLPFFRWLFF